MRVVIKRSDLSKFEACTSTVFDRRTSEDEIVYEDFEAEIPRLVRDCPLDLLWLISKGLVPMTSVRAKALIREAHGDSFFADAAKGRTQ